MSTEPLRHIAHLDMDAFYASVELLRYPELRGKPVVIGGGRQHQPEEITDPVGGGITRKFATLRGYVGRGVITTATYEARALGLHSAQGLMKAAQLAPDAILLPTDFERYRDYSRRFKASVRAPCWSVLSPRRRVPCGAGLPTPEKCCSGTRNVSAETSCAATAGIQRDVYVLWWNAMFQRQATQKHVHVEAQLHRDSK